MLEGKIRIIIQLDVEEAKELAKIAYDQGRSRKNLLEHHVRKLLKDHKQ